MKDRKTHLSRLPVLHARGSLPLILLLILLLSALIGLHFPSKRLSLEQQPLSRQRYCVIIDAGSTGTRLFAYSLAFPDAHDNGAQAAAIGLPTITQLQPPRQLPSSGNQTRAYDRIETEPGLDKFLHDRTGLRVKSLNPLLDLALEMIPDPEDRAATPILLFATAGLRRLPEAHREWVMTEIRTVLADSPFLFKPELARIISGKDEAVFGWVALNFAFNRFSDVHGPHQTVQGFAAPAERKLDERDLGEAIAPHLAAERRPTSHQGSRDGDGLFDGTESDAGRNRRKRQTIGALDLGGSSFQITFEVPVSEEEASRKEQGGSLVAVTIGDQRYLLFARSHEGYGMNDAFERSVALLLQSVPSHAATPLDAVPDTPTVRHPCLLANYTSLLTLRSTQQRVRLQGQPEWKACRELSRRVVAAHVEGRARLAVQAGPRDGGGGLDPWASCQQGEAPPCVLGVHQPKPRCAFVALSGFFVISKFFDVGGLFSGGGGGEAGGEGRGALSVEEDEPVRRVASTGGVSASQPSGSMHFLDAVLQAGADYCGRSWSEVVLGDQGRVIGADKSCFRAAYASDLLRHGLLLDDGKLSIHPRTGKISWTLGAVLVDGLAALRVF